ncbi:MAG: hypothetical protein KGO52_02185 [Nitrospirota bacterium]|nr:hypothetical protein [Nitrospirota bacterium]MDE3241511.1 hypothetical protein [Nitrospirota bacterium]
MPVKPALLLITLCLATLSPLHAAEAPSTPPLPANQPNESVATDVLVRVVAHGAMVLGDDVGGARITITDVATGRLLASGLQRGESGDQTQIMRTPRIMEEPRYSSRPSASFSATLFLDRPTLVDIAVQGPLAYPWAMQRASKTVLLVPGQAMKNDGIVLHLYGFIVQIESPAPGTPLIAKEDVKLKASVRTLSGSLVRPHGDWDSRKVKIYGEVLIGQHVVEQLQMFYTGDKSRFEAPFFVPLPTEAPDGITLRVVAADEAGDHFGVGEAKFPVLPERLRSSKP